MCVALSEVSQDDKLYEKAKKSLEAVAGGSPSWDESEMADAWLAFLARWRENREKG